MEEFKDIPWYEWLYQVNKKWDIINIRNHWKWNKNRCNILNKRFNRKWYNTCYLSKDWISRSFLVHRLVMLVFNWKSELQVNHINGIKTDNRLENLEYCTQSENINHALNTWLIKKWEYSKMSKKVLYYDLNWIFINKIVWVRNLAKILWLDSSNISKVCRWIKKSYKWYIFKYE